MNESLHDLLAATADRTSRDLEGGKSFAAAHGARVARAIRTRRAATYAGAGTAAAAFAVGAGLGITALTHT